MDGTQNRFGFEDHPPHSPFALNAITILVYLIAAVVVFCWFIVLVDDARPLATRFLPRGEVIRPTPAAAQGGAQEEKTPSPIRPVSRAQ